MKRFFQGKSLLVLLFSTLVCFTLSNASEKKLETLPKHFLLQATRRDSTIAKKIIVDLLVEEKQPTKTDITNLLKHYLEVYKSRMDFVIVYAWATRYMSYERQFGELRWAKVDNKVSIDLKDKMFMSKKSSVKIEKPPRPPRFGLLSKGTKIWKQSNKKAGQMVKDVKENTWVEILETRKDISYMVDEPIYKKDKNGRPIGITGAREREAKGIWHKVQHPLGFVGWVTNDSLLEQVTGQRPSKEKKWYMIYDAKGDWLTDKLTDFERKVYLDLRKSFEEDPYELISEEVHTKKVGDRYGITEESVDAIYFKGTTLEPRK